MTYQHPQPVEAQDALKDASQQAAQDVVIPADVQAELLPPNPLTTPLSTSVERRFRVSAKEVPASEFFASLMKGGRYSVAVHPGVAGLITLDLKNVTCLRFWKRSPACTDMIFVVKTRCFMSIRPD